MTYKILDQYKEIIAINLRFREYGYIEHVGFFRVDVKPHEKIKKVIDIPWELRFIFYPISDEQQV